jgi:hypothetical protein
VIINNYPKTFLSSPGIDTELFYKDYSKLDSYIKLNCANKEIWFLMNGPFVADYYNYSFSHNYLIPYNLKMNALYDVESNNSAYVHYGGHKVNTNLDELKESLNTNNSFCIILNDNMNFNYDFIDSDSFELLKSEYKVYKLSGVEVITN